jgi:hypothetical protein
MWTVGKNSPMARMIQANMAKLRTGALGRSYGKHRSF